MYLADDALWITVLEKPQAEANGPQTELELHGGPVLVSEGLECNPA